jgi:hypothetical protein
VANKGYSTTTMDGFIDELSDLVSSRLGEYNEMIERNDNYLI